MNFEDAWSSHGKSRLTAAPPRATWHAHRAGPCTVPRATPHGRPGLRRSLREMFGAVVSGTARHVRLPMKKDSASPIGQSPLPPRLEPETTKPKIGWKMKNVSRSTVEVRLLDFRGHREVSRPRLSRHLQETLYDPADARHPGTALTPCSDDSHSTSASRILED